jgi:hypothetical protein
MVPPVVANVPGATELTSLSTDGYSPFAEKIETWTFAWLMGESWSVRRRPLSVTAPA